MILNQDRDGHVHGDAEMTDFQRNMKRVEDANLPPCLFCEGRALLTWKQNGYAIQCENRFNGCPMNSRTHRSMDVDTAIERWKTRPGLMREVASMMAVVVHESSSNIQPVSRECGNCTHGTPHKLPRDPKTGSICEVATCDCGQLRLSV